MNICRYFVHEFEYDHFCLVLPSFSERAVSLEVFMERKSSFGTLGPRFHAVREQYHSAS